MTPYNLQLYRIIALFVLPHLTCIGNTAGTLPPPTDSSFHSKKHLVIQRIKQSVKIDGILDEDFWKGLPVADNFVVYAPGNGSRPTYPTDVRFAYDDEALYIGAVMFDPMPDSICKELGKRDQIEALNTDYISIDILPYNDGLNMYEFKVSPSNLQNDCKYSAIGQDFNWDAVWESATQINKDSWVAEIRIPYSALRFPNALVQEWGINMWRNFQRKREYSTWTFVDNKDQDIFKYYGTLQGITNIQPPLRLSVTPYLAGYLEKSPDFKEWQYSTRGGLDLRYGINESYTLDMMLIPDFGQVQSDDIILNLTPFEVRYDEKRQFFSEATELFNKCGIFYSRRVGRTPRDYELPYYEAQANNEQVTKNPTETRIINATKVSGRNSRGLGVSFFNAMTSPSRAELVDSTLSATRKMVTQPYTNYNVFVLDQNLKNNSYATLINTNYWIPDSRYLANVTGTETRLNTKNRLFAFFGRLNFSQVYDNDKKAEKGYRYLVSVSKPNGNFQYEIMRDAMNSRYNPNDMGYITHNNAIQNYLRLSYILFDPVWKLHSSYSNLMVLYNSLYSPDELVTLRFQADNMTTFKNFWSNYLEFGICPKGYTDFYEPRIWGWKYHKPDYVDFNWRIASDARKKLRIHNSVGFTQSNENQNFAWFLETMLRMRFSDRFTTSLTVGCDANSNDFGWVDTKYDTLMNPLILFGRRDVTTISNILNIKYIFNTKLSLNLRGRHYWSRAEYLDYYKLNEDGNLTSAVYPEDPSMSFNVITADLQFVWYFAPGSEISVVWKNYIQTMDDRIRITYRDDFVNTIKAPQANSFSVRVLYYLDYQRVKKVFT